MERKYNEYNQIGELIYEGNYSNGNFNGKKKQNFTMKEACYY